MSKNIIQTIVRDVYEGELGYQKIMDGYRAAKYNDSGSDQNECSGGYQSPYEVYEQ